MPRITGLLIAIALLLAAAPTAAQQHGGYSGQQTREIKALSAQETADLLAGRGMGLARAAELNGHPGPMHVLELHDALGLSPAQFSAAQASFERMKAIAQPLGAELVERERMLDSVFRTATATTTGMAADTEEIGRLQGKLRAVHLVAHLEMRELLTPNQVIRYSELRGYADSSAIPDQAPRVPKMHGH